MRKTIKLQIIVLTIIFIILSVVVPITGVFNAREGDQKIVGAASYNTSDVEFLDTFNGLHILVTLTFIDIPNFAYKLHLDIIPRGNIANEKSVLVKEVKLYLNGNLNTLSTAQPIPPQDLSLTFYNGATFKYPFDSYQGALFISSSVNEPVFAELPVAIEFYGTNQGWTLVSAINTENDLKILELDFTRSLTTKFFSLFIIVLMWLISMSMFVLAVEIWIKNLLVDSDIMVLQFGKK